MAKNYDNTKYKLYLGCMGTCGYSNNIDNSYKHYYTKSASLTFTTRQQTMATPLE